MTITLPAEIERKLIEQAGRLGTSAEALAIQALRERYAAPADGEQPASQESLADFLGDSIGCISSDEFVPGGARMSDDASNKFTEGLLERRKQGRL